MYLYKVWTDDVHQEKVFMSCDGEESQIRVLLEKAIADNFSDLRIVIAKTPRSCSGVCQASDISEGFKEEKGSLKKATDDDFADPLLQSALEAVFAQYILENPTSDIKSDKKTTYIHGLLAMTYATQNVQTRTTVQHGYSHWGQKGGAIDLYKIMAACRVEIPKSQMDIMVANIDTAVNFILERGRIPEDWYDTIGITRIADGVSAEKEEGKKFSNIF